jgi:hypothetical protein
MIHEFSIRTIKSDITKDRLPEGMMKSDGKIMNAKRLKLLRMKEYIRSKRVSSSVFHLQTA